MIFLVNTLVIGLIIWIVKLQMDVTELKKDIEKMKYIKGV